VATLEIELVGFETARESTGQTLLFFASKPEPQLSRDFGRDRLLNLEYVLKFPVVAAAPKLRAGGHVDQLCSNDQFIISLQDPSRQHGGNVELLPDGPGVGLMAFKSNHRAPRHNAKFPERREAIDDAFRDPVAKVFSYRKD
jgi:hypothetical protein